MLNHSCNKGTIKEIRAEAGNRPVGFVCTDCHRPFDLLTIGEGPGTIWFAARRNENLIKSLSGSVLIDNIEKMRYLNQDDYKPDLLIPMKIGVEYDTVEEL